MKRLIRKFLSYLVFPVVFSLVLIIGVPIAWLYDLGVKDFIKETKEELYRVLDMK